MPQSAAYISTASGDQLRDIVRKYFKKESEILKNFISDTHDMR